jgi:hypothetical protein
MGPEASSTAGGFKVGRHFEGNRLAGDCQARAYEQVLPVAGRSEFPVAAPEPVDGEGVPISTITKEGVAA